MKFKKHTHYLLTICLCITLGCNNNNEVTPECGPLPNNIELTNTQALFLDLAFNQEFGQASERLRKWNTDITIFIEHTEDNIPTEETLAEIDSVIAELNTLSTFISINKVSEISEANLRLFLGAKEDYVALVEPQAVGIAEGNSGFATIAWNNDFEITRASACVDVVNTTDEDRLQHIVREELAQALGLINDTEEDQNSIFYQFFNDATSYSPTDEKMIALMLGNELRAGMCANEILNVVQ